MTIKREMVSVKTGGQEDKRSGGEGYILLESSYPHNSLQNFMFGPSTFEWHEL